MMSSDEVYQAAMQSGQGGIRWNSTNNWVQLMDQNKNWVNWQYYNPNSPIDLIPSMNAETITRNDGVTVKVYFNKLQVSSNYAWKGFIVNSSSYNEATSPVELIMQFSAPQIATSFEFYNYSSNVTAGTFTLMGSNNGTGYDALGSTVTRAGNNSSKEAINVPEEKYVPYKYFKIYLASGGNYANNSIIASRCSLKGYTYAG